MSVEADKAFLEYVKSLADDWDGDTWPFTSPSTHRAAFHAGYVAGQRAQAEKDAEIAETNCGTTKHRCKTFKDCIPRIAAAIRGAAPKEES